MAREIWKAWSKINYTPVLESMEEILDTVLWGNSLIRRRNQPVWDSKLVNSQVGKIIHIYNVEQRRFLTFHELKDQHQVSFDVLFYMGLLVAIPTMWKVCLHNAQYDTPLDRMPLIEELFF